MRGDAVDWYLIGRIIGVVFWPAAVGIVIYGLGWLIAAPRPPHLANKIKGWFRLAAILGFIATLFLTVRELLRHTGAA